MRAGLIGNQQGLARQLSAAGVSVVVHPAGTTDAAGLGGSDVTLVDRYDSFFGELEHPRLFVLDLPLGGAIDRAIDEAYVFMEPGDAVLDPSGSYWGDTLRRFHRMRHRALFYVDLGLIGEAPGATILAAGDSRGVDLCWPLLERLAKPRGVVRAGGAGAAHFAVMVREAVATSTVHALSEARQLLEAYPNHPEPAAILEQLWPGPTPDAPRAAWLLDDAVRLEAAIPLLAHAIMLELGAALDDQRPAGPSPRVGGFVHPDEIL
ncbi:MAG TPA: NAD(P)-binding domain-containing protein [Geminicoccaceae bacterium]|nr:NAD(P)-binding domain-containing protein [Geminicoccaceae bacterium]